MNKKLTLSIILSFFVSSLFLISSQVNAGLVMPYMEPSNCCSPPICDKQMRDGKESYECDCDYTKTDIDQVAEYICEPVVWGDGDDWVEGAGCDDDSCENIVCQMRPSCCMEEMSYMQDAKPMGGWDEQCEELADQYCPICGGVPPGDRQKDSDGDPFQLYSFFDLRDRDSFVQVTNVSGAPVTIHVQIFDVSNLCNENNFYDVYTGNDTHVYNMSDILTNDTNPSGVALPDDAYGIVVVTVVTGVGGPTVENSVLVGNFRILDDAGYEYRTNMLGIRTLEQPNFGPDYYFNYNVKGNVTLSDVVGIPIRQDVEAGEVIVSPLQDVFATFDIDIYNTNEVPFSCRDIIFACIESDDPTVEQLLENSGISSVASFEYGINNAIPHSRGSELLCPGNNISDGIVVLRVEQDAFETFIGYVGLNSGNGRGSMDSLWEDNYTLFQEINGIEF